MGALLVAEVVVAGLTDVGRGSAGGFQGFLIAGLGSCGQLGGLRHQLLVVFLKFGLIDPDLGLGLVLPPLSVSGMKPGQGSMDMKATTSALSAAIVASKGALPFTMAPMRPKFWPMFALAAPVSAQFAKPEDVINVWRRGDTSKRFHAFLSWKKWLRGCIGCVAAPMVCDLGHPATVPGAGCRLGVGSARARCLSPQAPGQA